MTPDGLDDVLSYQDFYDAFAKGYDIHMNERNQHLLRILPDLLELEGKRVVDIGVGTAGVWAELDRVGIRPAHLLGVDISHEMLGRARGRGLPYLETVEGTVEDLPPGLRFDVVTVMGLVRHCGYPHLLARHARRLLEPGGTLLVEDLSQEDSNVLVGIAAGPALADLLPQGVQSSFHLPDETLRKAIEAAGFSLLRWEPFGYRMVFGSFIELCGYFLNETMLGMRIQRLPDDTRPLAQQLFRASVEEVLGVPVLHRSFFVAKFE